MFCGVGGLPIDDDLPRPLPVAQRRCCSQKPNKNPYSGRGLDKFSAVLAELESKRENILKTIGPQGVATVRFMYTDSNWVPIIVKQRPQEGKEEAKKKNHKKKCNKIPPLSRQTSELCNKEVEKAVVVAVVPISKARSACERGPSGKPCQWPINYWLFAAMILLCLALFGRTFAICCTSVWWYVVQPADAKRSNVERMAAKKRTPATRTAENKHKDRRG